MLARNSKRKRAKDFKQVNLRALGIKRQGSTRPDPTQIIKNIFSKNYFCCAFITDACKPRGVQSIDVHYNKNATSAEFMLHVVWHPI